MKRLWLFLIPSFWLLSGCIPIALLAGATIGGAVIYDNRSLEQISIDHEIAQQARLRLNANASIQRTSHIAIASYHGILLLVGQTPNPQLRNLAYHLVKNIPHVIRTYNEISIAIPNSSAQRTQDGWITTKVKSAMLAKPGLRSTEIKVVTENNVVYLMGFISHKQAALASDVARRIQGVSKVVQVFEYSY